MSLTGSNNEQKIWNYLYSKLSNAYGTAGLMGNIYAESGLKPKNLQNSYETKLGYTDDSYTTAVDNGTYTNFVKDSAGYGLVQWTYWSRKQAFLNYVKSKGKSIGDLETQLEYVCKELEESYNEVWVALKNATSVANASNGVLLKYEKPADQSASVQSKRAGYGQVYYNKYAASSTSSSTSSTSSSSLKIVESILTKNPCYTAGRTIAVKGLMLHSIGTPQPSASVFVNSWNSASYSSACVHAFIDGNTGTVYQTLPWNHRGWHCGASGNNTHIGVEMCEPSTIKYTSGSNFTCSNTTDAKAVATRTYNAAVELFAYLCKQYSLDPTADGVIVSHSEGYKRGIASNHADPEHLWSGLGLGYTMDGFRKAVKAKMSGVSISTDTSSSSVSSTSSTNTSSTNTSFPSTPFTVKVLISNLNIRKTPSSADDSNLLGKYTGKGTFTIVEQQDGWGLLSSYQSGRNGWIYLKNASYVTIGTTTSSTSSSTSSDTAPFKVKVTISDLNIRKGAGTEYAKIGKYTGKGTFTIVEVASGTGSESGWGLLKAYEKNRNGWISLDYVTRL